MLIFPCLTYSRSVGFIDEALTTAKILLSRILQKDIQQLIMENNLDACSLKGFFHSLKKTSQPNCQTKSVHEMTQESRSLVSYAQYCC